MDAHGLLRERLEFVGFVANAAEVARGPAIAQSLGEAAADLELAVLHLQPLDHVAERVARDSVVASRPENPALQRVSIA